MKSRTAASRKSCLFTGEQNDVTVNQSPYFLRARYYDPLIGRFLTRDPWPASVLTPQSQNRYAYVYNDPVRFADQYGYFGWDDITGAPGNIIHKGGEIAGGVVDTCSSAVGAAANWTVDQAARAGAWLSSCNGKKIVGGAIVLGGGAVALGLGGYVVLAGAGVASEATTALGLVEGLHTMTAGGAIATGGLALGAVSLGAFTNAGCGKTSQAFGQTEPGPRKE